MQDVSEISSWWTLGDVDKLYADEPEGEVRLCKANLFPKVITVGWWSGTEKSSCYRIYKEPSGEIGALSALQSSALKVYRTHFCFSFCWGTKSPLKVSFRCRRNIIQRNRWASWMFAHGRAIREADVESGSASTTSWCVGSQKPAAQMILQTESKFSFGFLKLFTSGLDWEDWSD